MSKRYTIQFESSHKQWVIIDKENPDDTLGYFYAKPEARKVADKLNQRDDLLAALDEIAGMVESLYATPDAMDDPFWQVARAAIAKAGGE